jgi:hypothetical protein
MDRRTVLLRRFKTAGLLAAAACILLTASPANAGSVTTYNNATAFETALAQDNASYYKEDFNSPAVFTNSGAAYQGFSGNFPLGDYSGTMNFSNSTYSYTVGAYSLDAPPQPSDLYVANDPSGDPGDLALSTFSPDYQMVFTLGNNINVVGGNFFLTAGDGSVATGKITVTLSDGTHQTFDNQGVNYPGTTFGGFIANNNATITSVTVDTQGNTGNFATVDNFYVGSDSAGVNPNQGPGGQAPEPGSIFLLLGGLTAGALKLRKRLA